MDFYKKYFRPAFFDLPAEKAHDLSLQALRAAARLPTGSAALRAKFTCTDGRLRQTLLGCEFPNPVGLAAGFDKNGEAANHWQNLGFGFCEIGTVTARPQNGNPSPRLFRLPEDEALINRMGFNNAGAEAIAHHLERSFSRRGRPAIPLGINIGKSKVTELTQANEDYLFSLEKLYEYADFIVVNVSSPNTPGLRDLQEANQLRALVNALLEKGRDISQRRGFRERALLVKLAPDLDDETFRSLIRLLCELGIAGVVLANTSIKRDGLTSGYAGEAGGLSGAPLRQRATNLILMTQKEAGRDLVVVGCGGIFSADDAWEKILAGASLVQVYTGLVYEGPSLPRKINEGLLARGFRG